VTDPVEQSKAVGIGPVWVITDGKIGDDVQCLAVAAALDPAFEKRVVRPRPLWAAMAPWGPIDPRERPSAAGGPLAGALPEIAIVSGRRAIPYARALKKASGGAVKIVVLKDPRFGRNLADVLWAPAHDGLTGANVILTLTSPHGLAAALANDRIAHEVVAALPKPMLGILLGGVTATKSGAAGAGYSEAAARDLGERLSEAGASYASIAVTPSRRTPPEFLRALERAISHDKVFVWDGAGANPYADILKASDAIVVAGDSHNMMSEALASKAAVYVWRPAGVASKLDWFIGKIVGNGAARLFENDAPVFDRIPVDATAEIVVEIRRRLKI